MTNAEVSREKPHYAPPSLHGPPHREPFELTAPTLTYPRSATVIRIRGVAVGRPDCWKQQQRDSAKHRGEPPSPSVLPPASAINPTHYITCKIGIKVH